MTEQNYLKTLEFLRKKPWLGTLCVLCGRIITLAVYILYPLLLLLTVILARDKFLHILLVPAVSFLAVTLIRHIINAPRPYVKYNITPLYNKKTKGNSFPSRHTFSVFIIAFSCMFLNVPLGLAVTVLGIILAVTRVLCGVHFIKDVLAGFVFAAVAALGFLI